MKHTTEKADAWQRSISESARGPFTIADLDKFRDRVHQQRRPDYIPAMPLTLYTDAQLLEELLRRQKEKQ